MLDTTLAQLLAKLQEPLMKVIPGVFLKLIPGWKLVPKKIKKKITDKIYSLATSTGGAAQDALDKLTKKFQELCAVAADHIVKLTTIDHILTSAVLDTKLECIWNLAERFSL